jgi:hypothetical protein
VTKDAEDRLEAIDILVQVKCLFARGRMYEK